MSLIKYQVLVKVDEVKSFTKAADQLGLTQSAVSHAVAGLEEEFGFRLISRHRSGISLTREGMQLLPSIQRIVRSDEKLHQEAASILGVTGGSLCIGVFTSVSRHLLPQIIQVMDKKCPELQIRLTEGNYEEIEEQVISGKLDCGFVNKYHSDQLTVTPLIRDRILCIVSPKSVLYNQTCISFSQMEQEPFIMPAFGGYHEVKRILAENGVHPKIRFELMEENAILAMVSHHLGISILPELVIPGNITPLKAIPLEKDSYRTIGLATSTHPSPAAKQFVAIAKQVIGNGVS
ncbi:LysR family transcriptional regulator [Sporolactobacillus pectinivorans]|uniref:LysR family transcriptional regulator n=1 Tax=Sporolactobacillus pectinivorans TaxID=1591408 RepID=UPI000C25CB48|nr:LysR family transcriptional regulator [Sporolactobacillus pectinivorans]